MLDPRTPSTGSSRNRAAIRLRDQLRGSVVPAFGIHRMNPVPDHRTGKHNILPTFDVHNFILLRLKYFATYIKDTGSSQSQKNDITLPEDAWIVKKLIQHLYEYPWSHLIADIKPGTVFEDTIAIYEAADKYMLPDLKAKSRAHWDEQFVVAIQRGIDPSPDAATSPKASRYERAFSCLEPVMHRSSVACLAEITSTHFGWKTFVKIDQTRQEKTFRYFPQLVTSWARRWLLEQAQELNRRAEAPLEHAVRCPSCSGRWSMNMDIIDAKADLSMFCPRCGKPTTFERCIVELAMKGSE